MLGRGSKAIEPFPDDPMLYRTERRKEGTVPLQAARSKRNVSPIQLSRTSAPEFLYEINNCIEGVRTSLWPVNKFIHANPELAFEEHKAHSALTEFMRMQDGWKVTPSAYGIETAWVASYDSRLPGPVISFNAEMGMSYCCHSP